MEETLERALVFRERKGREEETRSVEEPQNT
jgi:hypothetical protein